MEILMWFGVCAVVALLLWAAAPHHQRMIDNRPKVDGDQSSD
jgi:hypothetical protein